MTFLADLDALETDLAPVPLFPVEEPSKPGPDPRLWPEIERQKAFIAYLRKTSPKLIAFAIPNAGKRSQWAATRVKAEGLMPGAFDTVVAWDWRESTENDPARSVAWIEWKGMDARGRPGRLSPAQIDFGNALVERGHAAACFYTVKPALLWLRSLGAPVGGRL